MQTVRIIVVFVWMILGFTQISFGQNSQPKSILATGEWFKFKTEKSGIHRIGYQQLMEIGLNPDGFNPTNLQVYGGGSGMLPQTNTDHQGANIEQYSIEIVGGEDGTFDDGDFILIYVPPVDDMLFDFVDKSIDLNYNLYDRSNYFFITIGQSAGKRVIKNPAIPQVPEGVIYDFDDFYFHKSNNKNLLASGRQWVGERMAEGNNITLQLPLRHIANNTQLQMTTRVLSTSRKDSRFDFKLNNSQIGAIDIKRLPFYAFGNQAEATSETFVFEANIVNENTENKLTISFDDLGGDAGYLDFLLINYKRKLLFENDQLAIRSFSSMAYHVSKFHIDGLHSSAKVWNVSTYNRPEALPYNIKNGIGELLLESSALQELVIFDPAHLPSPIFEGKIDNQDLLTMATPELLIITVPEFFEQATRLAAFRASNDGIESSVIDIAAIYNDFGAGRKDITSIRNCIKHLYNKSDRLRYVLLLGDASYDYLSNSADTTNLIPTYQSRNSIHNVYTYASDDYFGFMDDDEGEWKESNTYSRQQHDLDIGIGRLPVKSTDEAKIIVDKLIAYAERGETDQAWRNRLLFVADDGENNKFQAQSDFLATNIEDTNPQYVVERLFVDAHPISKVQGRKSAPRVRELINQYINEGVLLMDFIGHGGETALTNEGILDLASIAEWENENKLPLIITATCEFGRHDDWEVESGAEKALFKKNGGAIGLLTTSRPSVVNTNFDVSKAFYDNAFNRELSEKRRLGDIFRLTKNQAVFGVINRNFVLLGDPSMRLAYPKYEVVITEVNEGQHIDSLSAYSKVKMVGEIRNGDILIDDFNGILNICLFDEKTMLSTLGNGSNRPMTYESWQDLLVKGAVSVESGQFTATFTIPGTGSKPLKAGKLLLYAFEPSTGEDAAGSYADLKILDDDINTDDTTGPVIDLTIDYDEFENGGLVGENINLLVELGDESGINLNTNPQHAITMYIDDLQEEKIVLTQFYKSNLDDFNNGSLSYLISDLSEGEHTLTLEASDNFNNRSSETIGFVVAENDVTLLQQLKTFPNPAIEIVKFEFHYQNPPEDLLAILLLYSSQGELLRVVEKRFADHSLGRQTIEWNLTNSNGRLVKPGLYFYDFYLVSLLNKKANKKGKLLIHR